MKNKKIHIVGLAILVIWAMGMGRTIFSEKLKLKKQRNSIAF